MIKVKSLGQTIVTQDGVWKPITHQKDMDRFYAFISEISKLLNGPCPPENPDSCKWCYYRMSTKKPLGATEEIPF